MANKQQKAKRDPASVIMPDECVGNISRTITDNIPTTSVIINDKRRARKITYSLHPKIIEAVERYAEDNYMPRSQVVAQAIKNLIPPEYFQ